MWKALEAAEQVFRAVERAMAELQRALFIVKTEERYEPTFSYRWDLLERWLPDQVAEGRQLSRTAALDRLLALYEVERSDGETATAFFGRVGLDRVQEVLADVADLTPELDQVGTGLARVMTGGSSAFCSMHNWLLSVESCFAKKVRR